MLTATQSEKAALRVPSLSVGQVWVVCALVLVLGYVCSPASFALDLWQHLSIGREMVRAQHVVDTDRFTHTLVGPVLHQNWLSEVVLYLCFRVGGLEAVTAFAAALYVVAFGALTYICWKRCGNTRVAVGCTLLAAAIASENLSVRTQVFSAMCLSLELVVLWTDDFRKWRPLIVAAIVVLWTNTHGAFMLGVALPGLFAAGRAVDLWLASRGEVSSGSETTRSRSGGSIAFTTVVGGVRKQLRPLISDAELRSFILTAACAAVAAFCNPHSSLTIHYIFDNMGAGLRRNIQEWQPIPFASVTGKFFFGSVTLLLVVLSWSRKRIDATEAILLIAFLCLGAKAWRMAIWWGFVMAPILARHLATLLPREASAEGSEYGAHGTASSRGSLLDWAFLFLVLTMGCLSLPWFKSCNPLLPAARRAAVPPDEPHAMVAFLQQRGAMGNAFNPMEWGGYLMWHFDGRLEVFVDGRIDPFSDAVWSDYEAISNARADWEDLLARYDVTTLIASRQKMPALIRFAGHSPQWKQVYADSLGVVFERIQ